MLARHHISGMPVVSDTGEMVGMVTEHDLIAKDGAMVADIMSQSLISVSADTEVEEVAHLLAIQHIRRVPVLQGGKLVGIVSRSDLVRQIAMRWVCGVCGEIVRSVSVPHQCPRCGAAQSAFTREIEPPGM